MESRLSKKTVVIATDVPFWKCSAGNEQRITQMIDFFRRFCDVIVLYIGYASKKDRKKIASYELKNLYCAFEWKAFLKENLKLVINSYFPVMRGILKKMRKPGSLKTRKSEIAKNRLDAILTENNVHILCVEYVWMTYLFTGLTDSILKIIDTHDIQFDRCESFKQMGLNYDFNISETEEVECLNQADVVLAINHRDAEILSKKLKTEVVEYPYLPSKIKNGNQSDACCEQNGSRIAFIGSAIEFNIMALLWFCDKIWPIVKRSVPSAEFHVYGKVAAYTPLVPGVVAHGFEPNESDIYNKNDIFVNPIQMGGGLKIKCVEALMYAKPLVTTQVGAQGLESGIGEAFWVATDEKDYVQKLVILLQNSEKRLELSRNSQSIVNRLKDALELAENSIKKYAMES